MMIVIPTGMLAICAVMEWIWAENRCAMLTSE